MPKKQDIKTFNELLNQFPMIARQMQPGLDRLFKEFGKELGKPLPPPPSSTASMHSFGESTVVPESNESFHSEESNGHAKLPVYSSAYYEDDEDLMRRALETAVTAAIDLFRLVDKNQLSLLGTSTDLTGPVVERLIERYVTEQVHDTLVYPRLCNFKRIEDAELDRRIRQMEHVDVSQVGIAIEGGREGKEDLIHRLGQGVQEFRKMGVAGSPQEMLDILLATQKAVTDSVKKTNSATDSEKHLSPLTINADVLVSLLLIVVIRSQVRHMNARLCYMQHFIYVDDVESGEMGYALSTLEAVLAYLVRDAGGLRKASARNRRLWQSTKEGDVAGIKSILDPNEGSITDEALVDEPEDSLDGFPHNSCGDDGPSSLVNGFSELRTIDREPQGLSHVFPFQNQPKSPSVHEPSPRVVKKVSMSLDNRSMSGSSGYSFHSRASTLISISSGIEGDTSIESLSKTQDSSGDSIPMMAVEANQPAALKFLLGLQDYYSPQFIFEDVNNEGTTLLSAAVQLAHTELIDVLLDYIERAFDGPSLEEYLRKADSRGRTVAHYLFDAPSLINRLSTVLPWRQKDKNGQTPLFALCRSYDHSRYREMVYQGSVAARESQGDRQSLRLDDHIDNRGNTLLHIVNDHIVAAEILRHCNADPNAVNDKKFTPLMVASKYGRQDMVRVLFREPRVDAYAKELRGMTAVELAKDDEVRNSIDDLILFANPPGIDGRITTVVRSFFVEDATIRLIIKSGAPSSDNTYIITTCRRSLWDFENLAKWLAVEHPASWLPSIFNFRSPFQIPSKPSRAVLHGIQVRLDHFLKIMLAHSTFSTHELLWEFFLVPEIQPEMMANRSQMKAAIRSEKVIEEYSPISNVRDVEQFVSHAREMVRSLNHATKSIIRRATAIQNTASDFSDALSIASNSLRTFSFIPPEHLQAFTRYAAALTPFESSPYKTFTENTAAIHSTILAILSSLARPHAQVDNLQAARKGLERQRSSLRRGERFPFLRPGGGLLEESRQQKFNDALVKIEDQEVEIENMGKELRYTQSVVAGELAAWQAQREEMGKRAVRELVKGQVVREKERLRCLIRGVRGVLPGIEERIGNV